MRSESTISLQPSWARSRFNLACALSLSAQKDIQQQSASWSVKGAAGSCVVLQRLPVWHRDLSPGTARIISQASPITRQRGQGTRGPAGSMLRGHPKRQWPGECDPGCPEPAPRSQGMRTGVQNGAARKGTARVHGIRRAHTPSPPPLPCPTISNTPPK